MRSRSRCMVVSGWILAGLGVGSVFGAERTAAADTQRQGNVFGINLGWASGCSTVATGRMLGMARHLVGDWGYLRPGVANYDDLNDLRRSVAMIRAHRLIPIGGGAAPPKSFREEGKEYPRLDSDGTMRSAAREKAQLWRCAYEAGIPLYSVEVLNEVNIGNNWPAEKYAQWLYDFAVEVKKAYPGLKVCSAGMAGSGAGYYEKMLKHRPELKDVIDFWGLHPYGANNPPEKEPAETTLRSHELTARVLADHGIDPIRLMATETGYELELGDVGKNTAYPPIKEDNRAEYMARAFRDYYVPDQRVEVVSPFMLWDLPWHGWDGWNFIGHDGVPKPMYDSVAAEPKTKGYDWIKTGQGRIEGRITWWRSSIGVPRVIVFTEPGFYGGVTDDEGRFEIADLPEGRYRVSAFADGFTSIPPRTVTVSGSSPARFAGTMERVSLVDDGFDDRGQHPSGWSRLYGDMREDLYGLDRGARFRGAPTLRVSLPGEEKFGLWKYGGYNSAYPNEVQIAEVFVRAERARFAPGSGPWLELDLCNGRAEILSSAKVFDPDFRADGQWHRLTVALLGLPRTSRVRLTFGVDNAEGTFWFSPPFVGEADFPLPTDRSQKTTGYVPPLYERNKPLFAQTITDIEERNKSLKAATITGQVRDFRGVLMANATVATDAPVFVAVTDHDGRYKLTVPAGKKMRVRAFALGETPAVSEPILLHIGKSATVDLATLPPKAFPRLVNGGFNEFTPDAPGLMDGWQSFGATDGTTASTKMIFGVPSYEGEGLYFAQSGSNTKNGGAVQLIEAEPGKTYRLTGRVYTRTEGGGKRPLDNNCRLGLDPTGGRDPEADTVVWTKPTESEQKWALLTVEAKAETTRIAVFVRHEMRRANTWNLTLFDDLKLDKID